MDADGTVSNIWAYIAYIHCILAFKLHIEPDVDLIFNYIIFYFICKIIY